VRERTAGGFSSLETKAPRLREEVLVLVNMRDEAAFRGNKEMLSVKLEYISHKFGKILFKLSPQQSSF
jgi:hypothetical protein